MVKLIGSLSRFKPVKVLLIGDFMLDLYTSGSVDRISPEAPVPILHVQKTSDLPGGAGNVALNLLSLGAKVIPVGRVGDDREGRRLKELLEGEGIDPSGLFVQKNCITPLKNRLIADAQQLMRIDHEKSLPLDQEVETNILAFICAHLEGVEVIAISDYGKGSLTSSLLFSIFTLAVEKGIPTIVDPKGEDFTRYRRATLIKPNQREAIAAAKLGGEAHLDQIGKKLLEITEASMVMVTRSERGITLFDRQRGRSDFPVKMREVKDVTGAGDTVLALTTLSFACGIPPDEGIPFANIAAGIAIERLGCARVSLSDIADRILKSDVNNKIFNELHLFALESALQEKTLTILGLSSKEGISPELFASIRRLSKERKEERLMIYLQCNDPSEEFLTFLSSLQEVDYIVIKSKSLASLSEKIHPKQVFVMEGKKLRQVDSAGILLALSA